jgi:hypothetical protein
MARFQRPRKRRASGTPVFGSISRPRSRTADELAANREPRELAVLFPERLDFGRRGDVQVGVVADLDAVHRVDRRERRRQCGFGSARGSVGAVED